MPRGGGVLGVEEYLEFLGKEYLATYISRGGAAVKVAVVGSEEVSRRLSAGLAETVGDGFVFVAVDAAGTRVHMVDQVFAAVARQVDWVGLAGEVVRRAYEAVGFPAGGPGPADLSVSEVAAHHEVDATELYRSVRRSLEQTVLGDATLTHEFRVAMLRLCQAPVSSGSAPPGCGSTYGPGSTSGTSSAWTRTPDRTRWSSTSAPTTGSTDLDPTD